MFSNETGLSNKEVSIRQKQYGLNALPEEPSPSKFSIFIQQLKSPLVYILLLASLITLIIGHYVDTIIISIAVFVNTILGYIQENKTSIAMRALRKYVAKKTIVIREGKRISVNVLQIVPGDLVILNQGSMVPADGKITFDNRLYIDEAILTGESMPVNKTKDNDIFMGTTISSGEAIMVVNSIGSTTRMGAIAGEIQKKEEDTPLQKQLKGFSKQLVFVIVGLTILVFILGVLYGFNLTEIFITSVALAVSSIPEGLLVSLTVVLTVGIQKILKHHGLVRKLSAAETLGNVTVICTDKTGTLTEGKMEVVDYVGNKEDLAKQVLLANDFDDPIVIAAFEWGKTIIKDFINKNKRIDSIPFSSKERFFISLNHWSDRSNMVFMNGAPEVLIKKTILSEKEKKEIIKNIENFTKKGKRVVGFIRKEISLGSDNLDVIENKKGFDWVGLLVFSDPVRVGVKEVLEKTRLAGIKTIVITGDYSKTSEFVLKELGISINSKEIITGDELEKLTVNQLSQKVKHVKLFARTTPEQKFIIVEALKKNGEVVAMMGDGVNDAPALHKADIGIVVEEATDIAKESADLILLDSNFSTIAKAVEEGRGMFENIRKIILYLMSDAFAEIILIIISIAIGLPLPITAVQILWINLISDGFPSLALTIDPVRTDIMKDKPHKKGESLVNIWMISLIGMVSIMAGVITLLSFLIVYKITNDLIMARSMAFLTLGLDSLVYVFSVKSFIAPFWKNNIFENKWLIIAVLSGLVLQILPFLIPTLRQFFGLSNLPILYWLISIASSILIFFTIELFKIIPLIKK